jgi:hypothetical protein
MSWWASFAFRSKGGLDWLENSSEFAENLFKSLQTL